jgi:hypothetical protein
VDFIVARIFGRFGKIQHARFGKLQEQVRLLENSKSMIGLGVRGKTSAGARAPMTIQQHRV